ncbi:MAG: hypothetical protein COB14_02500 [Alphaproteobacteria bacterium]|nr:MAG: hypothetical protein COB14_02500 [Alphaproteobacteria bacterium]
MTHNLFKLYGVSIVTLSLCAGCSSFYWPQHGHGGIAEGRPHMVHWHYERHQLDLIKMQITDVRQDMHILRHNDADKYHPALMHDIEMQMILVEREFEGHFYKDTENNLIKVQNLLIRLQKKMEKHQI